jgi:hypothetical protein
MKVEVVTSYRVRHLRRYGVTVRGNVASVYPPLWVIAPCRVTRGCHDYRESAACICRVAEFLLLCSDDGVAF